jgi:hypothetical protein
MQVDSALDCIRVHCLNISNLVDARQHSQNRIFLISH